MSDYSLTVINDSELSTPTFAVFAMLPSLQTATTLPTAWLTQPIGHENHYTFTWSIDWQLSWSASGTKDGYQWTGGGTVDVDPDSNSECAKYFDFSAGDFDFSAIPGTADGFHLYVTDSPRIPTPSVQPSSIGVGLHGNTCCAVDAGPNLKHTFTLHPTYYIDAGDYVPGQMVDGSTVTAFKELKYEGGNKALTATLNDDNTWLVRPSKDINFKDTLATMRAASPARS